MRYQSTLLRKPLFGAFIISQYLEQFSQLNSSLIITNVWLNYFNYYVGYKRSIVFVTITSCSLSVYLP